VWTYSQKIAQLARTTPNEVMVTSLNSPPTSCVDMSKKKKKITSHQINDGGRGDQGGPWSPPKIRKKKLEVKKIKNKNIKFDSNFSHLAPSQKLFGPIFRFYGHIQ
jgi:hypothetical protein